MQYSTKKLVIVMLEAAKIADYFLSLSQPEVGDMISHLKLQKLLYYAQGFHIAITGKPLFEEQIVKWQYGPVVRDLYSKYKKYGAKGIEPPKDVDFSNIPEETKQILNEVYEVYGQFSALKLSDMTHAEPPYNSVEIEEEITHKILEDYFKEKINTAA